MTHTGTITIFADTIEQAHERYSTEVRSFLGDRPFWTTDVKADGQAYNAPVNGWIITYSFAWGAS